MTRFNSSERVSGTVSKRLSLRINVSSMVKFPISSVICVIWLEYRLRYYNFSKFFIVAGSSVNLLFPNSIFFRFFRFCVILGISVNSTFCMCRTSNLYNWQIY